MRCRESLYKDDEILFQNSNIEEIKKDASARAMKGQEGKQKNEKKSKQMEEEEKQQQEKKSRDEDVKEKGDE